jgi:hypothetical protein
LLQASCFVGRKFQTQLRLLCNWKFYWLNLQKCTAQFPFTKVSKCNFFEVQVQFLVHFRRRQVESEFCGGKQSDISSGEINKKLSLNFVKYTRVAEVDLRNSLSAGCSIKDIVQFQTLTRITMLCRPFCHKLNGAAETVYLWQFIAININIWKYEFCLLSAPEEG